MEKLKNISVTKLLIVFAISFSLATLPGPLSASLYLPSVPVARANPAPAEPWYPAGPAMNSIVYSIFDGEDPEFVSLQAAEPNTIDLTDWHLTPSLITSLNPNPNYFVTAPITETGYFELQFHLGSNFWGCAMNFGNSECGRNIRQAFAHALDKVKFTSTQGSIAGLAVPIDNPTPPSVSLISPNPCAWDQLHPQTGPDCIVKAGSAAGGSAYHLAAASAGVGPTPGFSWSPGRGTPDFCAAADHLIAAGLATGKDATTCSLTGIQPAVSANTVNVFVRSDNPPRLEGGQSYAQVMCALFTGGFSTGCPPFVTVTPGPITAFPGFTTAPASVEQDWNVYTGGFINVLTFDSSLFFGYHSQFVSGFGTMLQQNGGPCSNDAVPSFAANNYYYMCKQAYDTPITQAEFAPCIGAPGDPAASATIPTFVTCPGTAAPTFQVSAGLHPVISPGSSAGVPITVTSLYGFSGTVTLSAVVSPVVTNGPTVSLSTTSVALTAGTPTRGGLASGPVQSTLSVSTIGGTPQQVYHVTVTGTSGAQSSPFIVTVEVTTAQAIELDAGTGFTYALAGDPSKDFLFKGRNGLVPGAFHVFVKTGTPITIDSANPQSCLVIAANEKNCTVTYSIAATAAGKIDTTLVACTLAGGCNVNIPATGQAFIVAQNDAIAIFGVNPAGVLIPGVGAKASDDPVWVAPFDPTTSKGSTAKSAAYLAQDVFGQGAYTVPMWSSINKFGYRSEWQRVTLHKGNGLIPPGSLAANFNAWSPTPAVAGTIRQGYRQTTTSVDVYTSNTAWDAGITGNIWDGPNTINPDSPQTILEWMTVSTVSLTNAQLTYTPAPGTVATYRYTLRNDIFWHTGQKVTAWDLAFSDISYKATGTPPGAGLAPMVGVKVLSSTQVDLNVDAVGPFTQLFLSATVIPGRFWSSCGAAAWDAGASLSSFAAANAALTPCIGPDVTASGVILPSNTAVDIAKIQPVYDPIQNGIFVGSGSWVCKGTPFGAASPVIGAACVSTVSATNPNGVQNPPPGGSYTLQRNGLGFAPGASVTGSYFRSAGALALWIWSGNTGDFTSDFLNFGVVALCFGQALQALGNTSGCGHWQQGIGAPGGHSVVGLTQVGIVLRFVGVNWVAPFNWLNNPPQGIGSFPPVLYEGSATLNPASIAGCAAAYPAGGYNC